MKEHIKEYDNQLNQYYANRNLSIKASNWTSDLSNKISAKQREYLKEFILEKGFNLE